MIMAAGSGDEHGPVRRAIDQEAAHYHPWAQLGWFLMLFVGALVMQVIGGAHLAGWAGARSLLVSCAGIAWKQWRQTMPVDTARRVADEHEQACVTRDGQDPTRT